MKSVVIAGLACSLLAGCYTYRPLPGVDVAMPAHGDRVEIQLTSAGTDSLAGQIGPDVRQIQGEVVSADSTGITVAITRTEAGRRGGTDWKGEHVTIPRADIASVEQRKLAVGPTALLGGLAGGGIVAAFALIGGTGSSSGTTGPPSGTGPQ